MNIMLPLSREETEALIAWWADQIGRGSEAESDMASKRIAQLRRLAAPERCWDIEHLVDDAVPVFMGVDIGNEPDRTAYWACWSPDGFGLAELPTPSHFPEVRTR